ncbi:MAG TPA: hypothetical protein VHE55_00265 [Fimbriimonadaceae bacterium]|nr:hypothetical protein [Fimbriimonadaceae bacterium]
MLLIALAWQKTPQAKREDLLRVRFTVGTYDYYGYVNWGELGPIREEEKEALALMKRGDYIAADRKLRAVRKRQPDDLTAMQGVAFCAYKLKKLGPLINEVAVEARKNVSVRDPSPPHLVLFYQYVYGLLGQTFEDGDHKTYFNPADARTPAGFYYGQLEDDTRAFDPKNKLNAILYMSALMATRDISGSRHAAEAALEIDPHFYQMRLLYAESLSGGTLAKSDGRGKWDYNVPDDEAGHPDRAYAQALQVVKDAPKWLPGYYSAGCFACSYNKPLARKYLTYYVEHAERGTIRYRWAAQRLSSIGGSSSP